MFQMGPLMKNDVAGVRINPSNVEFIDTEENNSYRVNITVKNVSKSSKNIRYYGPNTQNFRLKVKNPDQPVAPGLEVPAVIEYESEDNVERKDRLVLTVDGEVIEIPLKAIPSRPQLKLEGPVDFGSVVANSKVIAQELPLYNHGSKAGEFKIKYSGDKAINIIPNSGSVPPRSVQIIKVEYVTKSPGAFDEIAKVKLEGQEMESLRIMGNVVTRSLELLSAYTEERLDCVKFESTFYGTDKTESVVLFNNGPEPVGFVCVLEENAVGQEMGIDLTKSSTAAMSAMSDKNAQKNGQANELTSLVTALPTQGVLGPYEKIPMFFRFSPRWNPSKQGFKCDKRRAPRQDFVLFMHIQMIGARDTSGKEDKSSVNVNGKDLEIALTGTALPALLTLSQAKYDFGQCPVGQHVDMVCSLQNESVTQPITYQFRRVAHFTAQPSHGKIKPGKSQDVLFSFAPNQIGTFSPTQYVDIIGQVADNKNPFLMYLEVIHSVSIEFVGSSDPMTIKRKPKFNPGITPKISNEVGMFVDMTVDEQKSTPRNAVHNAQGTKLHRLKSSRLTDSDNDKMLVAYPNDRARSIRPSDRNERYKTIFTRTERHTFVDPDYAYTDEEENRVKGHKNKYADFLNRRREDRINKILSKEFQLTNNNVDIGIKSASGIRPKKLLIEEVGPDPKPPTPPNASFKLMSTNELAAAEALASTKVKDGLNAMPSTAKEKMECSKILSPKQLHQVVIGPPIIDFGEVCLKSINNRELSIVNNLEQCVHVVVHIDCRELRQSSPLSQVVPAGSTAILPIIFESNTRGKFQRSLDYVINGFYKHHVTVMAEVIPVALELSPQSLCLTPSLGQPAESGLRGVVTLTNRLNHPAEFTWNPVLGERGTAFSIRPATGVVDAHRDLDCEVVFHPSYMAPEDGEFTVQVHGGNVLNLSCHAELGPSSVQFIDRRVMFGEVPLHLTTTKKAMLKNYSSSHAYFQVLDPNPFPGMSISPAHGVVPVGGTADISVTLTPNAVLKFDTRVQIAIRGSKTLELRMGGTVEPPCVEIDLPSFSLGGVPVGARHVTPFKLINKASSKARMEFDLSRYTDFTLNFAESHSPEDNTFELMNPGMYTISLEGGDEVACELIFKPTEVAAYDFIFPVTINQTGAPTPSPTPFPPTPAPSNKNSIQHIINPRPVHISIATPRRRVVATALRQPLQLSHLRLDFSISPGVYKMTSDSGIGHHKGTLIVNNSDKRIKWTFDVTNPSADLENGAFRFLHSSGMPFLTHGRGGVEGELDPGQTQSVGVIFCPGKPGVYSARVPIVIDEDFEHPYQHLILTGELKSAKLWFDPMAIVLTPCPLETDVSATFKIMASNYTKENTLEVEYPEVECEDGSKISPVSVTFEEGNVIKPCCGDENQSDPCVRSCKVTFRSPRPVSFCQPIIFKDEAGQRFALPVTATADNCLLTCYPFLSQHRTDHQIVCEQGTTLKGQKTVSKESVDVGEAVFIKCMSPHHMSSRPSTSATSSNFQISSSSYEDTDQTMSDSTYPSTPREGALIKMISQSDENSRGRNDITSRSLGSALFPDEESEEGIFHTEVLQAVQRWFSSQGWPGGPFPITIPESPRTLITKKPHENGPKKPKGDNNLQKEFKTVYDMIAHLSGRPVPGIPVNNPLPRDPIERVKQIYWQHSTLLTFLKSQGALVASVKPEYLMQPNDYKLWRRWSKAVDELNGSHDNGGKTEEEELLEEQVFEAVSKRAWTDILLQLIKTLVLAKITPRQFKNLPTPDRNSSPPSVNVDPLCSNIYGLSERILLSFLNCHYENQRKIIWKNCPKGGIPPSRWVVNFDFDLLDGLVIGALLGAHLPFLINTHLIEMYTQPATAEQCLHNALKVVSAMRHIGIDYDVQAIDITDPNPISLMLLCIHLYQKLPQYLPKSTIHFTGSLHGKALRQVRLNNPSGKPLVYHAKIAGLDARDFHLPKGKMVTIPPKGNLSLSVEFCSRFLRPAEAILVLVGHRQGSAVGTTLVFNLSTQIDNISPTNTVTIESPCYTLKKHIIEVTNPFPMSGDFHVLLVEAKSDLTNQTDKNGRQIRNRKVKQVKSRTDHGQKKTNMADKEEEAAPEPVKTSLEPSPPEADPSSLMSAFFCPVKSIHLDASSSSSLEIQFLPFHLGRRQCSIIFINEQVGEFLYYVDAEATLPEAFAVPFKAAKSSMRISSAAAAGPLIQHEAGHGRGVYGGDESVIYWKCEVEEELNEVIPVSFSNAQREKALVLAAQQNMSELEVQRRKVTGTLASGMVTVRAINSLSANPHRTIRSAHKRDEQGTVFEVKVDSEMFQAPATLPMAALSSSRPKSADYKYRVSENGFVIDDGLVELPIRFKAKKPGHYPCTVVLQAQDDIRVFKIECTVSPPGGEAHLEFSSPVHQPISQEIPVVNETSYDWPLRATITGTGFSGPDDITAKAFSTTQYPLTFKPQTERQVQGKLLLINMADGTEHKFHLQGKGLEPLPLDTLKFQCEAKKCITEELQVPNVTRRKLHYRVESDLPFISGTATHTVLPGKSAAFMLNVAPLRRGHFKGVLSFISGGNPVKELDSDGEEVDDTNAQDLELRGYRVWYSVEVTVTPPPPEKTLQITCACQKKSVLEVHVNNPLNRELVLEAEIIGSGLRGPSEITVAPKSRTKYELVYSPTFMGKTKASLIFFHEAVGEFWYNLDLFAESPPETVLPHMECELGRWSQHQILLNNPTDEELELIPTVSNTNNFVLERDNERPIVLAAHSSMSVPLNFMPSSLGRADHDVKITFHCEQLGEWVFLVSGQGLLPQIQDPVSITAIAGSNSTLIIPFRNPLDMAVLVDVTLTDKDEQMGHIPKLGAPTDSPFCLLLKHNTSLRVGPKSTLDIPISFSPEEMRMREAQCVVIVSREDGQSWKYDLNAEAASATLPRTVSGGVREIHWRYPIFGIPEAPPLKDTPPAIIACRARERIEERVVVTLSGVAPSNSTQQRPVKTRAITPKNTKPKVPEGVVVTEGIAIANEFTYEIIHGEKEAEDNLQHTVALNLIRQERDKSTGLVSLIFTVVYAPFKVMTHDVQLMIRGATGGIWKFPLCFHASEPEPDDTILVEAAGLGKESIVGFRVTSQTNQPIQYSAFFLAGSEAEFSVSPQTGELPPEGSRGTLINIHFTPNLYGKIYFAKLVIQTPDVQWVYNVKGIVPDYVPPRGSSSQPMAGPHPDPRQRNRKINYVKDNLKLTTTGVSSPIKGAPIIPAGLRLAPIGSQENLYKLHEERKY